MNNEQAKMNYIENYIKKTEQATYQEFEQNLISNEQAIMAVFSESIFKLNSLIKQESNIKNQIEYCECSILLSKLIEQKPCFIIELFNENWYNDVCLSEIFSIEIFQNYWESMRSIYWLEAKKYMGKILPAEADACSISWAIQAYYLIIPYFEKALINIQNRSEKLEWMDDCKFSFGEYRGMRQAIIIGG